MIIASARRSAADCNQHRRGGGPIIQDGQCSFHPASMIRPPLPAALVSVCSFSPTVVVIFFAARGNGQETMRNSILCIAIAFVLAAPCSACTKSCT